MLDPRRGGRCTARLPLSTCPPTGSIRWIYPLDPGQLPRIYPLDLSVGSIRWIYPLDLSVGRQLPTGAASCHWHILSQQPAQLALRWSRLSTPRGGPRRRVPGSPEPALPCLLRPCSLKRLLCLLALILVNSGKSHGDRQGQELAHTPTPSHPLCPLLAPRAGIAASWGLAGQGSPRGLFRLADFAKSLRFANSISHALSHPPSSSAWAAFALSTPRVARALLGAFAGPSQGRTLYCPVTAVHLPTRRIYPLSV